MSNWFTILKESQQTVDTKTSLNIISEPLGDNEECCEKARKIVDEFWDLPALRLEWAESGAREAEYFTALSCDDLFEHISYFLKNNQDDNKMARAYRKAYKVWMECEGNVV